MKNHQTKIAISVMLALSPMLMPTSVIAQSVTVVSVRVSKQVQTTVLSAGAPVTQTVVNSDTTTRTQPDGSVVKITVPLIYTIVTTPQTVRHDTYEVTTRTLSNRMTQVDRRLVSSVTETRNHQTQTMKRGEPTQTVVSGPVTKTPVVINTTSDPNIKFDAKAYYKDPAMGSPTIMPSADPAFYRSAEANNKTVTIVGAEHAYARGWTGRGSTVLIMDTGINTAHPDLAGKIKYQQDFTRTNITDSNGHGTHLAGIVAARRDGSGTHGVAFDANLAVAKIATGVNFNMGLANSAMAWASQYPDVIVANLSANVNYSPAYVAATRQVSPGVFVNDHVHYGGANYYNLEKPTNYVIPHNMVLTVSAGNSSLGYVQNPAVFAAATDAQGNLVHGGRMLVVGNWNAGLNSIEGAKAGHVCKNFQNNQCADRYRISDFYILAPGSGVTSTAHNSTGTRSMSGTSQAAPVVASAVAIINQLWPYMTPANQVQVLLRTANKNLPNYQLETHGQGLLDLDQATRPVGSLGISTTGRTGIAQSIAPLTISSSIGGVSSRVSSVVAVDEMARDFQVNLSGAVVENSLMRNPALLTHSPGQAWSSKLVGVYAQQFPGFALGQSNQNATVSINNNNFGARSAHQHQLTITRANHNPFVQYSGMWGSVTDSGTLEYDYTYRSDHGFWLQTGAMNINTGSTPGMVQKVGNLQAVHASLGYQSNTLLVYLGVQPWIVNGSLDLRIPQSVDAQGVMHYQHSQVSLAGNAPVMYAGMRWSQQLQTNTHMQYSVVGNIMGGYRIGADFTRRFNW